MDSILLRLARYYQIEIPGNDVLELYHQALDGLSIEQISGAASRHVRQSRFFPKVCELIELAKPSEPKIESTAEQQAAAVIQTIRNYGQNYKPTWADPITAHLMMGRFNYAALCQTLTESETKWFVKEFMQAYCAIEDVSSKSKSLMLDAPEGLKQITLGLKNLTTMIFESINSSERGPA